MCLRTEWYCIKYLGKKSLKLEGENILAPVSFFPNPVINLLFDQHILEERGVSEEKN